MFGIGTDESWVSPLWLVSGLVEIWEKLNGEMSEPLF